MRIENDKNYWLCLEPYTFIFNSNSEFLLYNSLSYKCFVIQKCKNVKINELLEQLLDVKNMYSVQVTGTLLQEPGVEQFVGQLRDGFFGDVYLSEMFSNRPVIFPPVPNIKNSVSHIKRDVELSRRQTILNFLHEITLYVFGKCENSCKHCKDYCKQFFCCSNFSGVLSKNDILDIVEVLKDSRIKKMNISGGNIFSYSEIDFLLDEIRNIVEDVEILFHFKNIVLNRFVKYLNKGINAQIIVTQPMGNEAIIEMIEKMKTFKDSIVWTFVVESETELDNVQKLLDKCTIEKYLIRPFFNGNNASFFEKNVYNDLDDILGSEIGNNDVFVRQSININDYGNLIVTPDCHVRANLNYPSQNIFKGNILDVIKSELHDESAWFRTRDKLEPCSCCIYKYLCPSPSNYELVIGKPNLCTVKP